MKRIILSLLLPAALGYAQEPLVLTLEDAIAIAQENSKSLRVSRAVADAADARAGEVRTALYPDLAFYGGYMKLSPGIFTLATPAQPTPISVGPVVDNTFTFQLGVRQPLFTGFRLSKNARAAELEAEATRLDQGMEESDLILRVTTAYWMLFQSLQLDIFANENVERMQSYLADTERMQSAGLATRNDILKVEVQLASAKIARIEAGNDVRLAEMTLNNSMGQPLETRVSITSRPGDYIDSDSTRSVPAGRDPALLASTAFQMRQDVQAFSARAEAARAGVDAARGNWWPQLELTAHVLYNKPNSRYEPLTDEFIGSWDIGIQMLFDIWNWGATTHRVEQAEAALRRSELQYDMLRDNVTLEVYAASLSLERAWEKLGLASLAVSQAEENVRSTGDKYRNGLATSSDLLDAEVSLVQAQTQRTGSQVEFALAKARLRRAAGQSL
jgi:outer membrane protein TolC